MSPLAPAPVPPKLRRSPSVQDHIFRSATPLEAARHLHGENRRRPFFSETPTLFKTALARETATPRISLRVKWTHCVTAQHIKAQQEGVLPLSVVSRPPFFLKSTGELSVSSKEVSGKIHPWLDVYIELECRARVCAIERKMTPERVSLKAYARSRSHSNAHKKRPNE